MSDLATLPTARSSSRPPLAAGIVNVTDDSFFAGARSGTPERAVADGLRAGRGRLRPARRRRGRGPQRPAGGRPRTRPRGWCPRSSASPPSPGSRCSPTPSRPRSRARALDAGRGGDQRHRRRRRRDARAGRRARLRLRAHAHRGPAAGRPRRRRATTTRSRTCSSGSRARIERAAELGVDRGADRARPRARLRPRADDDLELLRRLGELRALGRPLFVALSRKDFLGAIARRLLGASGCRPSEREAGDAGGDRARGRRRAPRCCACTTSSALDALRTAAAIAGSSR